MLMTLNTHQQQIPPKLHVPLMTKAFLSHSSFADLLTWGTQGCSYAEHHASPHARADTLGLCFKLCSCQHAPVLISQLLDSTTRIKIFWERQNFPSCTIFSA